MKQRLRNFIKINPINILSANVVDIFTQSIAQETISSQDDLNEAVWNNSMHGKHSNLIEVIDGALHYQQKLEISFIIQNWLCCFVVSFKQIVWCYC